MKTIPIRNAKTRPSELIEQPCRGENIVIANGSELSVLLPAIQDPKCDRKPGALRGKINIGPKFFEPLPPEELNLWD